MRVLLAVAVLAMLAGCSSGSEAPSAGSATTAAVIPGTMASPPPLTGPEQEFVSQLEAAGVTVDRSAGPSRLIQLGYDACSRLNYAASDAELAVQSVRAQGGLDDTSARAVVRTATDTLCPAASAAALDSPAPAPTASQPAALTTVGPGTYEVGTGPGQVAPGKYTSPGPTGGTTCYYARLKNNDGASGDIIGNDLSEGQTIMNVKQSDGYVQVRGCTFTKTG